MSGGEREGKRGRSREAELKEELKGEIRKTTKLGQLQISVTHTN